MFFIRIQCTLFQCPLKENAVPDGIPRLGRIWSNLLV
jgi:hypothetical protein